MHRSRRRWLPIAIASLAALVLLPTMSQPTDAATSYWAAKCDTNIRTNPRVSASRLTTISKDTVVTSVGRVRGGRYAASCPSYVKGRYWLKIVEIDGQSTQSLFGRDAVYAARKLFTSVPAPAPAPEPTPTPEPIANPTTDWAANCSSRLRADATTSSSTTAIIATDTIVSVKRTVTGTAWSADCAGSVSGDGWFEITAVNGKSVSSLYGVGAVYSAAGLYRTAETSSYQEGIDVSHWQGTIDFEQVAGAGKTFVIAKATEGIGWEDDAYDRNKADAMAAGLHFGAYHFARPGSNDPVKEADWFVDTAAYEHGMLIPTLDLERTGGLGPDALTDWVKAWLARVDERLGVKPMIYSSPAFWRSKLNDTHWFADNGYAVIWVAHWGVTNPSVPAGNWGGHSWTFWQYASDGSVPGISGNVDLDRYRFTTFDFVTY